MWGQQTCVSVREEEAQEGAGLELEASFHICAEIRKSPCAHGPARLLSISAGRAWEGRCPS